MHWDTLTDAEQSALWVEEDELETRALDVGIARFREQTAAQSMSHQPAVRQLIATATEAVVNGVEAARVHAEQGGAMKGCQGWGIPFMVMEPGVLAVAALAAAFDCLTAGSGVSLAKVISQVAERAQMEWHFAILKNDAPRLKAVMERRIKRWNARNLRRARQSLGELGKNWPLRTRRRTGTKLVEILLTESGLFQAYHRRAGRKTQLMFGLTQEAQALIAELHDAMEILSPAFPPMIVPPNDWAPGERGGYRILSTYTPFVIPTEGGPHHAEDHGDAVWFAINNVQRTPWRINTTVLDAMQHVWRAGGGWGGLPNAEPVAVPPYPEHASPEEQRAWRVRAAQQHQRNAREVGQRLSFIRTLDVAERMRDRVIYFPHRCDFRGRIYPIPQFLQPQGNDVARGLLTFADAKPLGPTGLRWLKIQYANCWGVDKVSFDERVAWTDDRLYAFMHVQNDDDFTRSWHPLDSKEWWSEADDPWQALATLVEIVYAYSSGDPESYECSLPVNVDGSNSGLQHFSAMLRDSHGGRLVNLVPSRKPRDIYSKVATWVKAAVEEDARSVEKDTTIEDLPDRWLSQGIDRKLCKRGTMTYCYGVTQQGLKDALIADQFCDWAEDQNAAVSYIGRHIWRGIEANVTAAKEGMKWLRSVATVGNKADLLLEWRTPSGFHVTTPYLDAPTTRVSCMSAEVFFRVFDPDAGPRPYKQRNSLPPNFVHSLDASHLMLTVNAGYAAGITHWMMIHDSFGTHAADMETLNLVLREEFVKLYSLDVMAQLRRQVKEQTGLPVPPPPPLGDLNLEEVYDSEYIFA
jgi:DNA-directed RNA polymerase